MARGILEICHGAHAGRKIVLDPGSTVRVGRTERADVGISGDAQMSGAHFQVTWDGAECHVRDLESARGTLVGGVPAMEAPVPHGGWIRAGSTDFLFHIEGNTPPPFDDEDAPLETLEESDAKEHALVKLHERAAAGTLFAVVDPAREDRLLLLMRESVDRCQSLYDGVQGMTMAEVAPYLVALEPQSNLLTRLIVEGWQRRWGVYLVSEAPFAEVRRHLRRLLMVEDERGNTLYFRFYDPLVLTTFLPTCTRQQRGDVFGDIAVFLLEGPMGEVTEHHQGATEPNSISISTSTSSTAATAPT
jgi:pSer/pThr/pTyr-binding forkhead associated (FHA) protein